MPLGLAHFLPAHGVFIRTIGRERNPLCLVSLLWVHSLKSKPFSLALESPSQTAPLAWLLFHRSILLSFSGCRPNPQLLRASSSPSCNVSFLPGLTRDLQASYRDSFQGCWSHWGFSFPHTPHTSGWGNTFLPSRFLLWILFFFFFLTKIHLKTLHPLKPFISFYQP